VHFFFVLEKEDKKEMGRKQGLWAGRQQVAGAE